MKLTFDTKSATRGATLRGEMFDRDFMLRVYLSGSDGTQDTLQAGVTWVLPVSPVQRNRRFVIIPPAARLGIYFRGGNSPRAVLGRLYFRAVRLLCGWIDTRYPRA